MFTLSWLWDDGKEQYVVGELNHLGTVKFVLQEYWKAIKFRLTYLQTGKPEFAPWLKETERY